MKKKIAAFIRERGQNYTPTLHVQIGLLTCTQRLLKRNWGTGAHVESAYWSYLDGTPTFTLPGRVELPREYCLQSIFNNRSLAEIEEIPDGSV